MILMIVRWEPGGTNGKRIASGLGGMSRRLLKFSGGSVDDYATFSAPGLTSPSC